jgi:hypothetical protein
MKKFLAVYMGTHASGRRAEWDALGDTERQKREAAGIEAWGQWMTLHAAAIVEQGGPLGKTLRASAEGITATKNALTGYVVVEADSHEAAARMFSNHPHFSIFPGDSVEIMECLPIPGQ